MATLPRSTSVPCSSGTAAPVWDMSRIDNEIEWALHASEISGWGHSPHR
jgi:hypothetical protein